MRLKARHILVRVVYDDGQPDTGLALPQLARAISNQVESNYGDYGGMVMKFAYQIKYFNAITGLAIIRIPRDNHNIVLYAISCLKQMANRQCKVDILHVSGTIKKIQLVAIELSRKYLQDIALRSFLTSESNVTAVNKPVATTVNSNSTPTEPVETLVLTSDGEIVANPIAVAKINEIEQEILNIGAAND